MVDGIKQFGEFNTLQQCFKKELSLFSIVCGEPIMLCCAFLKHFCGVGLTQACPNDMCKCVHDTL